MGIAVSILVFLVIAAIAWFVYSGMAAKRAANVAARQEPGDAGVETLRYRIPDAQDPAVVMAALEGAGYSASLDDVESRKHLVVACPAGRDRERARIRSVIEQADKTSLEGPEFNPGKVAFEDEK